MLFTRIKRLLIGEPLTNQLSNQYRLPKWKALSVLSSDALSSVTYATEEILIPLSLFALSAMAWSLPIAVAIAVLLGILSLSYRQTIAAYPSGGGAYIVAKTNLGPVAGLFAGASLLIDYALTVAVSVAASSAALIAAWPGLLEYRVALCVAMIVWIALLNLRGMKESSVSFSIPTHLFIFSIVALGAGATYRLFMGMDLATAPVLHEVYPEVPVLLALRAFSSGCAALTGIEAISSGIPMFQSPVQKNAKATLLWLTAILGAFFLGITSLAHLYGVVPMDSQTVLSQLAHRVYGPSMMYYLIQVSTALILIQAANTSYFAFPRLASYLAKDRYLPRQLASIGDKLAYSNGILGLSVAAMVLVTIFHGQTHALIPLYAIGVFLSFTLSQTGMVLHHLREKKPGWRQSTLINAVGAVTTFGVLSVIAVTKFTWGAWIVLLLIPVLVLMFSRIHCHYLAVGRELSLAGLQAPPQLARLKHTVIIPISGVHRGVIDALRYAISISDDVRACYVELDPEATERMQTEWNRWAHEIPFVVLKSPYRSVIRPLLEYVNDVEQITHNEFVTIIIPEFVTAKWAHRLLHNQTAFLIRTALMFKKGKVVTSVRYHLRS